MERNKKRFDANVAVQHAAKMLTPMTAALTLLSVFAITATANQKPLETRENIFRAAKEGVLQMPEIQALANPEITRTQLDNRTRLAACPGPLMAEPTHRSFRGGRLTMKVSCEHEISWSIYVPVRVTSDMTVVRVNRSLPRGTILSKHDLQALLVKRSPAHLPLIDHIEEAIGSALKRPLTSGTELQHSMLEAPVVVKRGDQTVIAAGNAQLSVRMTGKALQDGAIGEQIRVQNLASKRTIQGEVQADGSILVMNW
jgi:flagella basal body P-ring formation protein FlgA